MSTCIYKAESGKSVERFIADLGEVATAQGFIIHNEDKMEMAHTFGAHGVEVAEGFDLHMVQICKPRKAAKGLSTNPERAVLMPKFIMVFTKDGKTKVRMLVYGRELISELVDDEEFPGALEKTFQNLIAAIDAAV